MRSAEPEKSWLPSWGANASAVIWPVCPFSSPIALPSAAASTRMTMSSPATASCVPSGRSAIAVMADDNGPKVPIALPSSADQNVMVLFAPSPNKKDQDMAAETASPKSRTRSSKRLKGVDLSRIPPAPPPPASTIPVAASPRRHIPTQCRTDSMLVALVQFSSDPTGAEITIDGDYAGSTPSLIKIKPGTHSIKLAKAGFQQDRTEPVG